MLHWVNRGHFFEKVESIISCLGVREVRERGIASTQRQRCSGRLLQEGYIRPGHDGDDRNPDHNCTLDFVRHEVCSE